jgi:hypothetical protein
MIDAMVIKDHRGPPRYNIIGVGMLLLGGAAFLAWQAHKNGQEGGPATDFVVMAAVCGVASVIFLVVGVLQHKRATGG